MIYLFLLTLILLLFLLTLFFRFDAGSISEEKFESNSCIAIIVFISIIIVIISVIEKKEKSEEERKKIRELGSEKNYLFGKYLYGFKENQSKELIRCVETDTDFVFIEGGTELGRIPANSIKKIWVEDRSRITSRFTATRIVTLGIFALAAKKKETTPSYYITVEWETGNMSNNTIFEFSSLEAVNSANNNLRQKIDKVSKEIPDEPAPLVSSGDDIPGQIEKLFDMKDKGILTEEEFNKKKKELLDKM